MRISRAIFVDRDGVLNDLVYDEEEGRVGSPFAASEMRIFPYVGGTVKRLREELGFKVIVISNQPGVAKRQFTYAELEKMKEKLRREVAKSGTSLDGEYYCLHHPTAIVSKYRVDCDCRKPKPGLILRAAQENGVNLEGSYFVGDALVDVKAGRRAGCKTIMVGNLTAFLCRLIEQEDAAPDYMLPSFRETPDLLAELDSKNKMMGGGAVAR